MKEYFTKQKIEEFILINIGIFLVALSFTFFLDKNDLIFGGVGGIGVILKNVFGDKIPTSIIIFVINGILLLISLIFLGKSFFFKTMYGSLIYPIYSFILEISIPDSWYPNIEGEFLIFVVAAAIIMGLGLGIAMRYGSSTGGIDIIQTILLKYFKIPLSASLVIVDGIIMLGGVLSGYGPLDPSHLILYGIAYTVISGYIMDNIVFGGFNVRAAYVVTTKYEEIKAEIYKKLNRGVTELYSRGGYKKEDSITLLCVLNNREYYYLRSIALEIDPHAFIFVTKASEVHGEGFTFNLGRQK